MCIFGLAFLSSYVEAFLNTIIMNSIRFRKVRPVSLVVTIVAFIVSGFVHITFAGELGKPDYTKREAMVRMRDGVSLYTSVYEPEGISDRPVIMLRTPYSLRPYGLAPSVHEEVSGASAFSSVLYSAMRAYMSKGYIVVLQNVRGTYLSEGEFCNMRPHVSGLTGGRDTVMLKGEILVDEATDTYDTVEWILANTASNGKVGVKGVSYPGFYATMAILSRHPSIKAVSPQAPATDWFVGDDVHRHGAFCLADIFSFGASFFRNRPCPSAKGLPALVRVDTPIYEYFAGKSISTVSSVFGDSLSFWNDIIAHPDYDSFWKERDPSVHLKDVDCAVLAVGGFYDAEDCYGTLRTYSMLKKLSPDCEAYIALGPWRHGGWESGESDTLAGCHFAVGSASTYRDSVEVPFFEYYLDGGVRSPARVTVFPSAETSPLNANEKAHALNYTDWPPKEAEISRLVLCSDSLHFICPGSPIHEVPHSHEDPHGHNVRSCKGGRSFVSDPLEPVPYMESGEKYRDPSYMVADQEFAARREDVLSYSGRALSSALHVAGPIQVHIETILLTMDNDKRPLDADIVVKLIDVRPDGYRMLVRADVMPLRFRKSFSRPVPVKEGKRAVADFTMCDIDHIFMPGHRIEIQVQGSWFPLIAASPQTFLPNPNLAVEEDYEQIRITVLSGDSFVALPVLPSSISKQLLIVPKAEKSHLKDIK